MSTPASRRRLIPVILAALCGLLLAAPAADALPFNTWIGLTGLQAPTPSWVRDYSTGTVPTTVFAGTEGDGVYFSSVSGIPGSWSKMGTLPADAQEVYQVYTGNGKIYAVTGGGLFSTPSASASATWTPDGGGPDDAQNPTKLDAVPQAVVSLTGGPMLAGTVSQGVWRSGDGGNTWTPPSDSNGMPEDDTVWNFATFLNFVWAATSDGIYRSADQGSTWTLANDGIPFGDVTLNIFQETNHLLPNVLYAATSDGVYRTLDAGLDWQPLTAAPFPNGAQVHDMKEFSGDTATRLYTATSDGVWVATVPNVALPSPAGTLEDPLSVTWRQITEDGLKVGNSPNDIFWALSNFTSTPGAFLGGTQSNGGYMMIMQPPVNSGQTADLPTWFGQSLNTQFPVGQAILGESGNWSGTPDISYAYQWQMCTSTNTGSCNDIDGATDQLYTVEQSPMVNGNPVDFVGKRFRVCVVATNDFPEHPDAIHKACSAISSTTIAHESGPLPGDTDLHAGNIVASGGNALDPNEGDTLSYPPAAMQTDSGWWFDPPATSQITYQWYRCTGDDVETCTAINGGTGTTYKLTALDNADQIRVEVTGSNIQGEVALPISGAAGPVIPLPADNTSPPTLLGTQYVGDTLTGTVGSWKSPSTTWSRQWQRCEPDGSDCESISGANGPEYTLTADDYGMTVRLDVSGDVNASFQLPLAVDAFSPLTAVIQYPPGVTPPPPTTPVTPGSPGTPGAPSPLPTPPAPPTPGAPKVSSFKLVQLNKGSGLSFKLSGGGSVKVKLEFESRGHKVKSRCVAGKGHHAKKCTIYTTVETVSAKNLKAGTHTLALSVKVHGHRLKRGKYRAVITPYNAAGHAGTPHSLTLVLG